MAYQLNLIARKFKMTISSTKTKSMAMCGNNIQRTSWLHRASNNVETFLLPTDAHNVKKHRVIKTF